MILFACCSELAVVFVFVLKGFLLRNYVFSAAVSMRYLTNNNFPSAGTVAMASRARDPRRLSSIRFSREGWPVLSLSIIKAKELTSTRHGTFVGDHFQV